MLRIGAILLLMLGTVSACGHTPEERAVSGAVIGGAVGAAVGLATEPRYDEPHDSDRYQRPPPRHHRKDRHRDRHRHDDDWGYYDDSRYW
ncbi:MAG: hypothetical protein ACR2QJ_11190 [Geminicoccaceae bacterium]